MWNIRNCVRRWRGWGPRSGAATRLTTRPERRRRAARALAVAAACIAATPARADVFANFGNIEHSLDNLIGQAMDMLPPGLHGLRVGLGPVVQPNFLGDSDTFVRIAPVISLRYRNLLEVDNNAIRLNLVGNWGGFGSKDSPWSAGPAVNIDWGRSTSDSPKLQGIGGISTSFEAGAFVAYRTGRTRYRVRIRRDIAGATSGFLIDAQVDDRIIDTAKFLVSIGAQTTWANARYMNRWFGINPNQAAASGLPAYQAGAGMHDISVHSSAEYVLSDRWSVLGTFAFTRLLSSAAGSPLVKLRGSPNQPSAGVFAIYAF